MLKVAALCLALSGCSIALQQKPQHNVAVTTGGCSTSNAYWIADAALAAGAAAGGGVAYVATTDTGHSDAGMTAAGVALVASVIYLASAGNGYEWRNQCASGTATVATR